MAVSADLETAIAENSQRIAELGQRALDAAPPRNAGKRAYAAYLRSDAWKERARRVMLRAGGMCEACLAAPAQHVHHLTYEHVGNELMWELRAVCAGCHERIHAEPKRVSR